MQWLPFLLLPAAAGWWLWGKYRMRQRHPAMAASRRRMACHIPRTATSTLPGATSRPVTLWVAALLASDIGSLWGQVGAELFSGVMGVYFDPDIHEPVKTELLTPLYRLDQA